MTVLHDTFVIQRSYPASPAKVFRAWADPAVKARWFVGPDEWVAQPHTMDFRVGGTEGIAGGPAEGPVHRFAATYHEIVETERIVSTYSMFMDDELMSVSLATVELEPDGDGTLLTYTEHGAYLDDDPEAPASRLEGTEGLLDQLGAVLTSVAA